MTARRRRRAARRSRKRRGPLLLGIGIAAAALCAGVLSAGIWVLNVAAEAPPLDDLEPLDRGENSTVYAADGTRLGVISSDVTREVAPLRKIPKVVQQATVAIEDSDFYSHGGVDFSAIVRAAVENVERGRVVQGGSTITQQLVKNIYTGRLDDRDLPAKIQEAKLAEELERKLSKDEILEQYLNSAAYGTNNGRDAVGISAAARTYFDKRPGQLRAKEAALLAGLPQAPSLHNPLRNPRKAKKRRNDVLRAMARDGYISAQRAERLAAQGLGTNPTNRFDRVRERYFFDYVVQELVREYGVARVRAGGLEIHTTIELDKQEAARRAIASEVSGAGPSAAVVTTNARNGDIVAMVSSAEYAESKFNLAAQGHRQPGSSFKTMVLAAALDQGADPNRTYYVSRSPMVIKDPLVGEWEVNTFSKTSGGTMNLRQATIRSDNVVYAQLDLDVGPEEVTKTARQMGITTKLNSFPAEGIGGLEQGVTPLEMANAYGTLANGGTRHTARAIRKVVFPNGKVRHPQESKPRRAFAEGVAHEVTKILADNVRSGTGTAASIGCPQAGKTGTTDNHRDAWFVGYTPRLSTSVWVGYPDEQRSMSSEFNGGAVSGGTFPARIWGAYMGQATDGFCGDFSAPSEPFRAGGFDGRFARSGPGDGPRVTAGAGDPEGGGPEN